MTTQLSIPVLAHGHVGPPPGLTIREAFVQFHAANPHVYRQLVALARKWKEAGHRHCGIGMLFEVLRWQVGTETQGDAFVLNNNHRALYARRIMEREPDLAGLFELRELHEPDEAARTWES